MSENKLVYDSPYTFSARQRLSLVFIPPLAATFIKSLMMTTRVEMRDRHLWDDFVDSKRGVIVALHHESLALAVWCHRNSGFHTLTSLSYNGELAARLVRLFGLRALRGSSSKGGLQALAQLQSALELEGLVGWTVDGPRGPRRSAKAGIALLAAKAQVPILLNAYAIRRAWRMNSWDRFPIPLPFTKILCGYGQPIAPPASVSSSDVERTRAQVERELNMLYRSLEEELGSDASFDGSSSSAGSA